MGILAVGLRAAAGEVLRHAGDALRPELVALEAADVRGQQARESSASSPNVPEQRAQRGSVQRSAVGWSAARIPSARYSRRAMSANARTSSSSPRGGEPDRLGPGRERAGRHARRRVVAEAVPRVTRDRHRDPEARPFGELLEAVVPRRGLARPRRPVNVEVVDPPLAHELRRRHRRERHRLLEQLAVGANADRRVVHEPGLLQERHLREQVVDALLDRPARILVGVEPSVAVEVAEVHPTPILSGAGERLLLPGVRPADGEARPTTSSAHRL